MCISSDPIHGYFGHFCFIFQQNIEKKTGKSRLIKKWKNPTSVNHKGIPVFTYQKEHRDAFHNDNHVDDHVGYNISNNTAEETTFGIPGSTNKQQSSTF